MIEVSGRLTEDDLDDAARLVRSRWYWPKLLLQNAHSFLLVGAFAWATVLGLLGRTSPNWWAMGVIWLVILATAVWSAISVRRERKADLARLNEMLPETMTLDYEGLMWRRSGEQVRIPWGEVSGWHERGRVIALDGTGDQVLVFSVAGLAESQREDVRRFLRSIVPTSE